jgi:hypothetical protein
MSGSRIKHPQIIRVPIDALQERLTASIIAEEEGARELLSLADQHGDRQREARLDGIESARGASFSVCSEGGSCMNAGLPHGQEARAAVYGSLRVVVQLEEGHRGERLRDGTDAAVNRRAEQSGESRSLCRREANREPCLSPWELLRSIEAKREGEAETPSLAIGEASSP